MDKRSWEKAREILPVVRELSLAERNAYLESACAGDEELRRKIDSLLAVNLDGVAFLEDPLVKLLDPPAPMEGRVFGAYRVIRELGHGGMGAVYLAARADQEFEGSVAIKILRPIYANPEIEWRFRQEIQILANLNHPNIAKLYEVGRTEEGSPYFIMEYVDGLPITRFCSEHKLSISQRLRLFQKICGAVQYAHQNLVVHRDLKPSNILVTPNGEPKLLDFGIAKLLPSTDSSDPVTVTQLRFFTPDYASPEQVSGKHITTASDVYSLGVILYELLAGRRPYRLKGRTEAEIRQIVCEQEPELPSAALTRRLNPGDELLLREEVHRSPEIESRKLHRQLQGDLDKIVLMALRKEPSWRYRSVEQFAGDIDAYLQGFPVSARGDSWKYRATNFLRRNRLAATLTAAVILLSLSFGTLMALQQRQTARERDRAERISGLLKQILNTVDPSTEPINAAVVLDRGVQTTRIELSSEPELKATLFQTLGEIYTSWGIYDKAFALLSETLDLRRKLLGPENREVAETLYSLGVVAFHLRQFDKAEALLQDSLRMRGEVLGEDALELADNFLLLGLLYKERGDMSRTQQLYLKALELRRRTLGPDHPEVGILLHNLSSFYRESADYEASEKTANEALRILKKHFGPDHPRVASVLTGLAILRKGKARFVEAEAAYREALRIRRKAWGTSHPEVAISLNNLGLFLVTRNRYQEAEPLLRESLTMQIEFTGNRHPNTAAAMNNLGMCLERHGELKEALGYYRGALAIWKDTYPGAHEFVASGYNNIGTLLMDLGEYSAATEAIQLALDIDREVFGEDHPKVAHKMSNLGGLFIQTGNYSRADQLLQKALSIREREFGREHSDVAMTLHNLGQLRWNQGRFREAERLFREALAIKVKVSSPSTSVVRSQVDLADLLATQGRAAEAEPLIRSAVEVSRSVYPPNHWRVAQAESVLGNVLSILGLNNEAALLLAGSYARLKENLGLQPQATQRAYKRLKAFCKRTEGTNSYTICAPGELAHR
jgi:eukaryotic-like serine/threonine-protein kinase